MSSRRRTASVAAATLAVLALAALLWWQLAGRDAADRTSAQPAPTESSSATPSPTAGGSSAPSSPTSAEPAPGPEAPDDPASPDPATGGGGGGTGGDPAPGAAGRTMTVTVAGFAADTLTVSGYLDTVESGGTCHLLLESGDARMTTDSPAIADATTTSCAVDVAGARLADGTWTATLSYSSPTGTATSSPVSIEVVR